MKFTFTLFFNLFVFLNVFGQFSILKDIKPEAGYSSSNGLVIQKLKPGTWITSWDQGPNFGQELWTTDGTTAGTMLLKDIYPGPGWGVNYSSDYKGTILNNELFFLGTTNGLDFSLYKTDGSALGTTVIKPSIIPHSLTNIDNTIFFGGANQQHGIELYKTDGTAAGTVLVKDIWPGDNNGLRPASNTKNFVKANGYVFFRASDGVNGFELWRTDGTEAGTQMVKDIVAGPGDGLSGIYQYSAATEDMIEWNGYLYFKAQTSTGNDELWRTDGTAAGTTQVSQFNSPIYKPFTSNLIAMGDRLYFLYQLGDGNVKLFSSDGTTSGTKEVLPKSFTIGSYHIAKGVSLFYFNAYTPETGFELWRSDGTAAGTFMVKDLNPGPAYGMFILSSSQCFVNWDDIYFTGDNGQSGREIFFSDGSLGNVTLVFDGAPGNTDTGPINYSNVSNRLAVNLRTNTYGHETWISDNKILFPDLLLFTGMAEGTSAKLKWKTRNEESTSYFELEKSTDGVTFSRLATIQGLGANVMEANYQYTDSLLPKGVYYYRLKFFKTPGTFKYSNTVKIEITADLPQISGAYIVRVYPNPTPGTLKVDIGSTETINDELQITDVLGRILKRQKIPLLSTPQTVTLDCNGLAAGCYYLNMLVNGKSVKTVDFVVFRPH